jgi:uncharacterized protein (TIGR02266 family)
MNVSENPRRSLRAPINIWVRNLGKNEFGLWLEEETISSDFTFCYTTQDLSEGGIFLESDSPLSVNSELDLELTFPHEKPIRVRAKVKWVRDGEEGAIQGFKPGMGLEFINLAPSADALIRRYLEAEKA